MTPLGFKRKDLNPTSDEPKSEEDYENMMVYPEVYVEGKLAEAMGAEDFKSGDTFEATFKVKVEDHTETTEGGKTSYRMKLVLESMGDFDVEDTEDKDEEDAEEEESDMSDESSNTLSALGMGDG